MPRAKPLTQPELFRPPDLFPEHAKVKFDHTELVLGFMGFLRSKGITDLTWQEVHDLILDWRGVDRIRYEAETAQMKAMYPRLWEKYGLLEDESPKPTLRVTRPQVEQVQSAEPAVSAVAFLKAKIQDSRSEGKDHVAQED